MEVLTILLESEIIKGPLSLPKTNFGVSHLMFADDVLVFSKGDISNHHTIEKVF